jgi:putative hydrolase of the HAD superfamily
MTRETILIDADDTLWENNVFFEQTIEEFLKLLEPFGFKPDYSRHILNETERHNIRQHGYGVRSFGRSLEETYVKLTGHRAERETIEAIHQRVEDLEKIPPNVLDGVIETLDYLAERHRLILFTKGEAAEQAAKVERSGLQIHFDAIEIVPEKDVATYKDLVNRHHVVKSHGWMVGNSPRSDINPALEAGLNAVFIPHSATWILEHEEVRSGAGRLLILPSFRNLREHF